MPHEVHCARAVLASTLLDAAQTKHANESVEVNIDRDAQESPRKKRRVTRLRTGFAGVDEDVLGSPVESGLEYGRGSLIGIACVEARLGLELAYSTLTSHLIDHPTSRAFYIDTSKTFDPRRLHKVLTARLKADAEIPLHRGGFVYQKPDDAPTGTGQGTKDSVEERAMAALDRISVMRVFDFEGLTDAVLEVKARLRELQIPSDRQPKTKPSEAINQQRPVHDEEETAGEDRSPEIPHEIHSPNHKLPLPRQRRIADSQADDDASDLDVEEEKEEEEEAEEAEAPPHDDEDEAMLLQPSQQQHIEPRKIIDSPPTEASLRRSRTPSPLRAPLDITHTLSSTSLPNNQDAHSRPYLLLLPNPARILSPSMHENHIRTHALLVHLMRTLQSLTHTYPLAVLLINSTVEALTTQGQGTRREGEGPSAFASNAGIKPSLGKTWDRFLDLSCMVSTPFEHEGMGKKYVFEVLHDRIGGRVGRWSVLQL